VSGCRAGFQPVIFGAHGLVAEHSKIPPDILHAAELLEKENQVKSRTNEGGEKVRSWQVKEALR